MLVKYSPKEQLSLNESKNFQFKKKFGQNFIVDENVINKIVNLSGVAKETLVLEIGPGSGALTWKLSQYAKNVVCYEIDEKLKPLLDENVGTLENVEVIYEDFLKANINEQLSKHSYGKFYIVANLPYYITTPIIVKIIEDSINVDKIVIMVQKEVGDRFSSKPGNKTYGSVTVFLNHYFEVKKIMDVSRNVFMPVPNVDSIILSMTPTTNKKMLSDEKLFFALVRDAFKQKRKTIRNNLLKYDLLKIEKVLKKHSYDLSVRAENLSYEIFVEIANELSEK